MVETIQRKGLYDGATIPEQAEVLAVDTEENDVWILVPENSAGRKGTDLTFYRTTDGHSNVYVFRREDGSCVRVGPKTSVGQLHNRL